jgi:hypothetical protein
MSVRHYEETIVIFLDILGSREMRSFDEKYKIHKLFHEEIKANQALQETKGKSHVAYTRKLYSFSDCAYVFYKYKPGIDEKRQDLNKLFQVALFNTSLMMLNLLNEGYLIRGGVTYGEAYFDELSFFGPAVENAYLLESKEAKQPRILIDRAFAKAILEHEKKVYCEFFSESNPHYHILPERYFIPTIVNTDENDFILNVFYFLEMEGRTNLGDVEITHDQMKKNVLATLETKLIKYSDDNKIRAKLEWMKNFTEKSNLSLKNKPQGVQFTL